VTTEERFLRGREVRAMVGMGESSIQALEAAGRFPKRIKLSTRASAWLLSEVQKWMSDRVAASRGTPTK
jgi:prophage regulatory protein